VSTATAWLSPKAAIGARDGACASSIAIIVGLLTEKFSFRHRQERALSTLSRFEVMWAYAFHW